MTIASQRIPVTVVEKVSPDSVSFELRNLVYDEEEPGDFDASLGRTRTGSVQDDALPKDDGVLSSNVDGSVAWLLKQTSFMLRYQTPYRFWARQVNFPDEPKKQPQPDSSSSGVTWTLIVDRFRRFLFSSRTTTWNPFNPHPS